MKEKIKLKNGNILEIMQDEDPMNPRAEFDNLGSMVCWHHNYNLGDNAIKGKDARRKFEPLYKDTLSMLSAIAGMENPDDIDFRNGKIEKAYRRLVVDTASEKALILPLRLYDHSGITMSIGTGAHWADPGGWDSGQVGWIFLRYADARKNFKVDENDTVEEWHGPNKGNRIPLEDVMHRVLEGEVETYDQYLTGEVYGFNLTKPVVYEKRNVATGESEFITEYETIDSCWGFFGHNHNESGLYDHAGVDEEDILETA